MTEEVKEQPQLDLKELIRIVMMKNGEQLICCLKCLKTNKK